MARALNLEATINVPRNMLFDDLRLTPLVVEKIDEQATEVFHTFLRRHGEDPAQINIEIRIRELDRAKWQKQQGDPTTWQHVPFYVKAVITRRPRIF